MQLSIGSDQILTVGPIYDVYTSTYQNNATVSGAIYDRLGNTITVFTGAYVSASSGLYNVDLSPLSLVPGQIYQVRVVAVESGGAQKTVQVSVGANWSQF